jgi:hypothetical protein
VDVLLVEEHATIVVLVTNFLQHCQLVLTTGDGGGYGWGDDCGEDWKFMLKQELIQANHCKYWIYLQLDR